ncbi:uncharacterized protein B0T15DRAFT_433565 [Chaetomium strumarium]|uniref:Zn(2)-C6 fungal-type domain-containing protein n=1 Tax=Chaetomium strumarium TaxID=1170767 RepID=A0AAJ0GS09_9PEZI|nr:hypothetical protein B0T15DRAFT_433565 [Chaetomium strumarium]
MLPPTVDKGRGQRTRTNVRQSKYGCFTCKYRRVKCDEWKPSCRRCLSAKRQCLGYPPGAPPGPRTPRLVDTSDSASSQTDSGTPPGPNYNPSNPQNRFVSLARSVLRHGPRRAKSDVEVSFWTYLVPQLTQSIPSVRAAAAAFGASYERHVLRGGGDRACPEVEAVKWHTQALRQIRAEVSDVSGLRNRAIPCIVACLFLAFTEVLQHRTDKGHLHLQGVFALLMTAAGAGADGKLTPTADEDEIALIFHKLDLQSATYALGRPPNLAPPSPPVTAEAFLLAPPDRVLFRVLHSCYHFTSAAYPYRYVSRRLIPAELLIEQGRHLGLLQHWLRLHSTTSSILLRAQALAAFVYVATIFQPHETAFDAHGPEFQEIITLSAAALLDEGTETETERACPSSSSGLLPRLPAFSPEMGIIQPLFFAALKYRHPMWRRKALGLLRKSGREGPWCGEVEAAVASAVIRAEEEGLPPVVLPPGKEDHVALALQEPSRVVEARRVHACSMAVVADGGREPDKASHDGIIGVASRPTVVEVRLSRCRNVDGMLSESGRAPSGYPWKDQTHWETWIETMETSTV